MTDYRELSVENIGDILVNLAENHKKLLIIGHRNPDGDCVGSAFALKGIYEQLGGEARCAFCGLIPSNIAFMTEKGGLFNPDGENFAFDELVSVDVASPAQLGDFGSLADKIIFNIDHHQSFVSFSPNCRDYKAAAAGEIVCRIYKLLLEKGKIRENADICRFMYAAISADTGSFMFSNTTKTTHFLAAELCEVINNDQNGLSTPEIAHKLHNSHTFSSLMARKLCIERLELNSSGDIAFVVIENKMIEENSVKSEDLGGAVDIPRSLEGVKIAFVLKEVDKSNSDGSREFRISSRSNSFADVSRVCEKFAGGGHKKAAGGSVFARNAKEARDTVLAAFEEELSRRGDC